MGSRLSTAIALDARTTSQNARLIVVIPRLPETSARTLGVAVPSLCLLLSTQPVSVSFGPASYFGIPFY